MVCFALFKKENVKMFHTLLTDCPQNIKGTNNEVMWWHKAYVVDFLCIPPEKEMLPSR